MSNLKPNQYRCAICKGVFDKGVSDEEALAEMRATYGSDFPVIECDLVCDDCYQKIHPDHHPHLVEEAVADFRRRQEGKL